LYFRQACPPGPSFYHREIAVTSAAVGLLLLWMTVVYDLLWVTAVACCAGALQVLNNYVPSGRVSSPRTPVSGRTISAFEINTTVRGANTQLEPCDASDWLLLAGRSSPHPRHAGGNHERLFPIPGRGDGSDSAASTGCAGTAATIGSAPSLFRHAVLESMISPDFRVQCARPLLEPDFPFTF